MKMRAAAAATLSLVLVSVGLLGAAPASAQNYSFTNLVMSDQTTDLDISSIDVSFTTAELTIVAHTQNLLGGDLRFSAYVVPQGKTLASNGGAFGFGGEVATGVVTSSIQKLDGDGTETFNTPSSEVTFAPEPATQTIRVSIPTTLLPYTAPLSVFGLVFQTDTRYFGTAVGANDIVGFGPLDPVAQATTTTLLLSGPSQTYGGTTVTAISTVTPVDAAGTVQFFADAVPVGSAPVVNGTSIAVLPSTLASGLHQISAAFVPVDSARYASSTSVMVPLTVLSAAIAPAPVAVATTTKVSLSKKSQRFKVGKSAKVTVKLTPSTAVGKVVFYDGTKKLKTVTPKKGKATYTLSKKLKVGKHTIKAVFVPTDATAFTRSAKSVKLTVKR